MPLGQIAFLCMVGAAFVAFGVTLAWGSWYVRQGGSRRTAKAKSAVDLGQGARAR